jgi:prepilin-type N-terminal cleavage/methylation domain-containing protein
MHRRKGFTLIELLVVIAIIAILAAILFPVFAQARDKARQTTCTSNTKQSALAFMMYINDYDETFPWLWGSGGTGNWLWNFYHDAPYNWRPSKSCLPAWTVFQVHWSNVDSAVCEELRAVRVSFVSAETSSTRVTTTTATRRLKVLTPTTGCCMR